MNVGIVGSEGAKFTIETEELARGLIKTILSCAGVKDKVISGGCHLGGIDIWAVEEAEKLSIPTQIFLPKKRVWEGYKERNILIATYSDIIFCITVKELPPDYMLRGWEKFCYHCKTDQHIKSGGCWTVKYAKGLGKIGHILVVGDINANQSEFREV